MSYTPLNRSKAGQSDSASYAKTCRVGMWVDIASIFREWNMGMELENETWEWYSGTLVSIASHTHTQATGGQ